MLMVNRLLRTIPPVSGGSFNGRLLAFAIGLIFGAGGLGVLWSASLSPILTNLEAEQWQKSEATIISSSLSNSGDDGVKISILYSYQFQRNEYLGDVFNPTETPRNFATKSIREAVKSNPAGKVVPVWVNPENPNDAILDRTILPIAWMGFLFSIPFLTVGVVGISWAFLAGYVQRTSKHLREIAAQQAEQSGALHLATRLRDFDSAPEETGETILFLDGEDRVSGLGSLTLCLFVNGIISIFVFVMILMFESGNGMAIILFFFLLPFTWIGIGILIGTIRQLTGPRSPDYVILAHPTDPVAEAMDINLHWLCLDKNRNSPQHLDLRLSVARDSRASTYSWFRKKHLQRCIELAMADQNTLNITGQTTGESTFKIKEATKGKFFKSYQGNINLIVQWKTREAKKNMRSFTLGQTPQND